MIKVLWRPPERRPENATSLEGAIEQAVPAADVTLTLAYDGIWQVRALLPAAMCARGGDFASRDVSARVASVLEDHDCPARTFERE